MRLTLSRLMISVSGMRGIVGDGLSPEVVAAWAGAFGTWCRGGKVILGRDTRISGEMVRHATLSGLLAAGCEVQDVGIAPTPTIQLAVESSQAAGGIAITASHNPGEWNALKFFGPDGLFLDETQAKELFAIRDGQGAQYVPAARLGRESLHSGAIEDHLYAVLNCPLFDVPEIRKRNFRVAVDTVCGAGGKIIPELLAELGCQVVKLNTELTGIFPHNPEPLPENITELAQAVRDHACDVGFAVDPDVDRLAIVNDTGAPIGEENTLVLATQLVLAHDKGPVVANVSTTRALDDLARRAGVPIFRSKVGEIHVIRKMQEVGAIIGGEGNGGVIYPKVHYARDSAVGILMTLQSLVEAQSSLSSLLRSLPHYVIVKRKLALGDFNPQEVLAKLSVYFRHEEQDHTDGLKVNKAMGWFQVRASNTEPILRIYAEGIDETQANNLSEEAARAVQEITLPTLNKGGRGDLP
jgi:phosphomannomutase